MGSAARGAIRGAIDAAREIGVDAEEAAAQAATGALDAAARVSLQAVETVRKVATGTIDGVKVVAREPFGSSRDRSRAS